MNRNQLNRQTNTRYSLGALIRTFIGMVLVALPSFAYADPSTNGMMEGKQISAQLPERNMRFVHIDTLRGLSQDTVMAIAQDAQGFIWIATEEGLNRYDGQYIEQFERDPQIEDSLTHNWVWTLNVANDNRIWVGTDGGGINIFDPKTEGFDAMRHDSENPNSISSDRIRALMQDNSGHYWVGTVDAGLNRIDAITGEVRRYTFDPDNPQSIPHDSILTIYEDLRGGLWIGTDGGGLARYEPAIDGFSRYQPNAFPHSLQGWSVSALLQDRDGSFWVGTRDAGLNRLDVSTGKFEHFGHDPENPLSLSNNFIRDLLQDSDGTLWVATDKGLNEWRPLADGFARYYSSDTDSASLSENRLTDLFQSADGVLWVASYRGINTWNYLSNAFTHFTKNNGMLGGDIVTAIGESSVGRLWIGLYGGGFTGIDRQAGVITHFTHQTDEPNSLSSNLVMALHVDNKDRVWLGTRSSGLNQYDPETGDFQHITEPALSSNSVSAIFGDTDGTLWVGTFGGGLNHIDQNTLEVIEQYRHNPQDPTSIGGDRVLVITRDKAGTLWIGTEDGGLNKLDESTRTFQRYQHDPADPNSLSSNTAWEITETSDGSLWIATKDDGLNQWTPTDRVNGLARFTKWTKSNGLRSNTNYGLLEDNIGQLWISSTRGVSRINLTDYSMRHYDRRNGLIADEFNWGARYRSRMGQLVFGGSSGAVAFNPGEIRDNTHVPTAVVRAYSPLERLAISYSDLPTESPAKLAHSDNYIAFEFAALDYISPDKNEFRYKLEGFDETWQDPGPIRRVTYANLSSGTYLFKVRVANSDGVWNIDAGEMPVVVTPAWWMGQWAYMVYGIVAFGLVLLGMRALYVRRNRQEQQREQLEQEVNQRTFELGERNRQLESLNQKLLETSFTDSLTGLYNRRYMDQFIEQQLSIIDRETYSKKNQNNADYSRYQQNVLFFMMIDLDGFKAINDSYGHVAGDRALMQVKEELLGCLRTTDTIIRWGGDEFLIIGQSKGISGIANLAERVRFAVSEQVYDIGQGNTAYLSCSVGAVPYPFAPLKSELLNWEQSLNVADGCAYLVKDNGRNGWLVLSGADTLSIEDASSLPGSMESLLSTKQVQMVTSLKEPVNMAALRKSVA